MGNLIQFEQYFHDRAEVAESLEKSSSRIDAKIIATTAIDALSKIWLHDFPNTMSQLRKSCGGGVSEARKFSEFIKTFAGKDPKSNKIAVVCFAEDWKEACKETEDQNLANELLERRINDYDPYECPRSYLDISIEELEKECPLILENSKLNAIAKEYEYGALIYRFYRCPLAHSFKNSDRIHGYARNAEVSYFKTEGTSKAAIDFGLKLLTHWLRLASTEYVQYCIQKGKVPAYDLKSDERPDADMKTLWGKYIA